VRSERRGSGARVQAKVSATGDAQVWLTVKDAGVEVWFGADTADRVAGELRRRAAEARRMARRTR
jgi:hypothetical protein